MRKIFSSFYWRLSICSCLHIRRCGKYLFSFMKASPTSGFIILHWRSRNTPCTKSIILPIKCLELLIWHSACFCPIKSINNDFETLPEWYTSEATLLLLSCDYWHRTGRKQRSLSRVIVLRLTHRSTLTLNVRRDKECRSSLRWPCFRGAATWCQSTTFHHPSTYYSVISDYCVDCSDNVPRVTPNVLTTIWWLISYKLHGCLRMDWNNFGCPCFSSGVGSFAKTAQPGPLNHAFIPRARACAFARIIGLCYI